MSTQNAVQTVETTTTYAPKKFGICSLCGQKVALTFVPKKSRLGLTDYDSWSLDPESLPHPTEMTRNYKVGFHKFLDGEMCTAQNLEPRRFADSDPVEDCRSQVRQLLEVTALYEEKPQEARQAFLALYVLLALKERRSEYELAKAKLSTRRPKLDPSSEFAQRFSLVSHVQGWFLGRGEVHGGPTYVAHQDVIAAIDSLGAMVDTDSSKGVRLSEVGRRVVYGSHLITSPGLMFEASRTARTERLFAEARGQDAACSTCQLKGLDGDYDATCPECGTPSRIYQASINAEMTREDEKEAFEQLSSAIDRLEDPREKPSVKLQFGEEVEFLTEDELVAAEAQGEYVEYIERRVDVLKRRDCSRRLREMGRLTFPVLEYALSEVAAAKLVGWDAIHRAKNSDANSEVRAIVTKNMNTVYVVRQKADTFEYDMIVIKHPGNTLYRRLQADLDLVNMQMIDEFGLPFRTKQFRY